MATAPSSSAYGDGGEGVGGKFRKRPFRKNHTTPYDRPPTALRNPSWLSKLVVDPASKLISASAQRFFAPLFRKRLSSPPPPPQSAETNQDTSDRHPEAVLKAEAREAAVGDGENFTRSTDGGSISELEQLLKQKTFTRSEINHLMELLHSRAIDLPFEDGVKRAEANTSKQFVNIERQQQLVILSEEKRNESHGSRGLNVIPEVSTRVFEDDIASPAEIAKAYMDNQVSKVSPSMLGLRNRAARECASSLTNVPFTPKSTIMSLSTKANAHVEIPENGFTTPRSRGRSAIYNMARTPYSRVLPTASEKGSRSRNYGYGGSLLPGSSLKEPDGDLGSGKLAQKRRSSVLDEDLGSVGPMRRIRQKHNLLSHKLGGVSDAVQHHLSPNQKFHFKDEWKLEGLQGVGENDGNRTPRTSYARVPTKSSEVAARILEHLEKMTPKDKSAESKLIAARENSPAKLTTDMRHGQALKCLEDTDSSKLLQSNQDGHKLEDWSHSNSLGAYASAPAKDDRREVNGSQKLDSQHIMSIPVENSHVTASIEGALTSVETSDSVAKSVAQHPQKKRAFTMNAHEDSLELDNGIKFDKPASEPLSDGRGNQETFAANNVSASAEKSLQEKTAALPEIKTPPELVSCDLEIGNADKVGSETTGVTLPVTIASNTASQLVTFPPSALGLENPKEAIDKVTAFQSSGPLSDTEFSAPKAFSWANQKTEISSSSGGAGTIVTDASVGILGSQKGKDSNSQEAAKSNGKLGDIYSFVSSSTASGGISSTVPISSNNGSLALSTSTLSAPFAPGSTFFASQFTNNISNLASSPSSISSAAMISSSAASSSSLVSSTAVPSSPVMPIFKFGASIDPLTSASPAASAETPVMKTEKEPNSGGSTNLTFGNTSFTTVATGSNGFGLSSTITSSTTNSQSQCSFSSANNGSIFGLQSSVAGSGTASVNQGVPNQLGSSASSLVFGTSGVTSFTSGNTLLSSSTTTTKLFGTGTGFALSTTASLVETKSVSTGSGATSSIFGFGVSAPSSSSVANAISSNSGSSSTTFSFSVSSSSTSTVTNTSNSSSSTTPIFSFGGSNVVSSTSGGSTSIFGASPMSSASENNPPGSSSAVHGSIFGSSWQASKSPSIGSTFNSSPSTGFSFGAGSSSFGSSNSASMVFGSSTGASSASVLSFTTASATTRSSPSLFNASPTFGNSTPAFTATAGNNDQMNTEDSMAEDPVPSSMPAVTAFGQPPVSPSPGGFMFGSTVPSQATPFQFGGQQSQAASQNPSPFQASGSLEFTTGGSFSLGSGGLGGDKSGRKIVKVNRNRNRKK